MTGFILRAQQVPFLTHIYDFIENTSVFELNQVEGHTPFVPYNSIDEASQGIIRQLQGTILSLNGTWKFHYAETPEGVMKDFFDRGFQRPEMGYNTCAFKLGNEGLR